MKITNTTKYPTLFLRRLIGWCAKEVCLKPSEIRQAKFTKMRGSCRGLAGPKTILIRIGDKFPTKEWIYKGNVVPALPDAIAGLVEIATHELMHVAQFRDFGWKKGRHLERGACWAARNALEKFLANRFELEAEWKRGTDRVVESNVVVIPQWQKNMERARARLTKWEKKLKAAQRKVARLRRSVRRYERKMAAKGQEARES